MARRRPETYCRTAAGSGPRPCDTGGKGSLAASRSRLRSVVLSIVMGCVLFLLTSCGFAGSRSAARTPSAQPTLPPFTFAVPRPTRRLRPKWLIYDADNRTFAVDLSHPRRGHERVTQPAWNFSDIPNGTAPDAFSWSSDGRYLLLSTFSTGNAFVYGRNLRLHGPWRSGGFFYGGGAAWAAGLDAIAIGGGTQSAPLAFQAVTVAGRYYSVWPQGVPNLTLDSGESGYGGPASDDPAQLAWFRDTQEWQRPILWSPSLGRIVFQPGNDACFGALILSKCAWRDLDTATGEVHTLPYPLQSHVVMSSRGLVAGAVNGRVVVVNPATLHETVLGTGSYPSWSPQGNWVYYVSSHVRLMMRLHLQNACADAGCLSWTWVRSPVAVQTIWRVRPAGGTREAVTRQVAYGFAHLDVMSDGTVYFDSIPTDATLWTHRHQELRHSLVLRLSPIVRIERATPGKAKASPRRSQPTGGTALRRQQKVRTLYVRLINSPTKAQCPLPRPRPSKGAAPMYS